MRDTGFIASFCAVFEREVKGICANTQLVVCCFIVPVFWLLVVWGLLGQGVVTHIPIAFIDNDNSPMSRETARALSACRAVRLISYLEPKQALADMREGSIYGVMLVPAGYARDRLAGSGSSLVLWLDENRYAAANMLKAGIGPALQALDNKVVLENAMKTGASPAQASRILEAVHADFYNLGNEEGSFLAFLGSTLLPGLIMLGAMLTFVIAFLREYWHKSIADWHACANGRTGCAIAGKLLPYYAIYGMIFLFYMALFAGEGGFNITGSLLIWFALGMGCLADFAVMAIILAAISPNWRLALVASAGYAAPALPFTGFSMPLDSMGHAAAIFAHCLPLTWYIQGQAQEWTLGAPFYGLGETFSAMACLFILPLCLGFLLMRWRCLKAFEPQKAKA